MTHPSSSKSQTSAETAIREQAGQLLDAHLGLAPTAIPLPGGTHVEVDGVSTDPKILVEIYARIGVLKGGQVKKIAEDILKLITVRSVVPEWADARLVLVYASPLAKDSIRGWLDASARAWGVESLVVQLPADEEAKLLAAQARQLMINPPSTDPGSAE